MARKRVHPVTGGSKDQRGLGDCTDRVTGDRSMLAEECGR